MKCVVLTLSLLIAAAAGAAEPSISASIDPAQIALDQSARLTITASGDDPQRIAPPRVPGLVFTAVGQSRRVESVNGVTTSTFSVTYEVRAQQAGTYVIASIAPGGQPLMLRVDAAADAPAARPGASLPGPTAPSPSAADQPHLTADGAAFVRLRVPTRELYVGQSVPVEIQVGTRDGVVASLNGLPTVNGDAFTLDKLPPQPERRTGELIDGKPFTVFSWHSALAAIKPGVLSLSVEAPLTVRIPRPRPDGQLLDGSSLADAFDDPAFQGFFGASTEKDVVVSSPAANFTVLELPAEGRPKDFSGAVGKFRISSELQDHRVTVGDPVTLRMTVSGEGEFDRITSSMLTDVAHWKTYQPTAKFTSADTTAYRGEKTFEQPVVATEPGRQTLPGMTFSYFDPSTRRYETAQTAPLTVEVEPAPAGPPSARADQAPPGPPASGGDAGLRADHAPSRDVELLVPLYDRPAFLAVPSLMVLGFAGAWLWLQRRERRSRDERTAWDDARLIEPARLAAQMDRATVAGDVPGFFHAARAVMQSLLSARWRIAPDAVTLAEVDARLGADSEVLTLFVMAEEALYCGRRFARSELQAWQRVVRRQMHIQTFPSPVVSK
jgi:hypothetical protein